MSAKKKVKRISKSDKAWREGYDLGMKNALRENDIAIKIGRAIVDALDSRYEFQKEDY